MTFGIYGGCIYIGYGTPDTGQGRNGRKEKGMKFGGKRIWTWMLTAAVLGNAAVLSVPVYAQEETEFTDVTAEEILYAEDEEILLSDEETVEEAEVFENDELVENIIVETTDEAGFANAEEADWLVEDEDPSELELDPVVYADSEELPFDNSTKLPDGTYVIKTFAFDGGTGKTKFTATEVTVTGGKAFAVLTTTSSNMTHVYLGHTDSENDDPAVYDPGTGSKSINTYDVVNKQVEIPVRIGAVVNFAGRTTKMTDPHWVQYTYKITLVEIPLTIENTISMFKPSEATLEEAGEELTIVLKMESASYDKLFVGDSATAEAAESGISDLAEGNVFTFNASTLTGEGGVVSFRSAKNGYWYERKLTLDLADKKLKFADGEKADYTELEKVFEQAKALDPDLYTDETMAKVEEALEAVPVSKGAVNKVYYKSNQGKVDVLAEAIRDAIAALVTKEDQAAADNVTAQLAALKADSGLNEKGDVGKARAAYEALTDAQKALVDANAYAKLTAAESSVKKAEEDAKKAEEEAKKKSALPAAGTTLTSGNAKYTVVTPGSTVAYQGPANKKAKTATVPAAVTIDGVTYQVDSIAANAFKNCNKLTKVTINANIKEIGANAFAGTKSLGNVIIKSKQLAKIGKKAFSKAGSKNYAKLKVRVPKAKLKAYRKMLKNAKLSAKAKVTK